MARHFGHSTDNLSGKVTSARVRGPNRADLSLVLAYLIRCIIDVRACVLYSRSLLLVYDSILIYNPGKDT